MNVSKKKLRLLEIFPSTVRGGAEEYALTIASAATKYGWDVRAAFPKADKTVSLVNEFCENNVRYHPLDIRETENSPLRLARTIALLIRIKPDVVHIILPWQSHGFMSIIACGMLKIPTVVTFQLAPYKLSFSNNNLSSDIPKLLKAADLFVFPTHFEGLPFSPIEAMAHDLPVVASNASSIPEIIENKVHGLLFRKGDSCDLLETLRFALRNPTMMQEMAENAKLRVKDFSEEKMVTKTLELIELATSVKSIK